MGLPYSRQINLAFEQVTPLVAAAYKALRTTRDISIFLAVIQVLNVVFLGLILVALVALLYSVNPDLAVERQTLITPWLVYFALYFDARWILTRLAVFTVGCGIGAILTWRVLAVKQWVRDIEYQANVDAEHALEELDEEEGSVAIEKDGVKA